MRGKIIHKKKKERIYNVSLIFLGIISFDLILNSGLPLKPFRNSSPPPTACITVDESQAKSVVKALPEVQEFEQVSGENGKVFNLALSSLGNTWTIEVSATSSGEKEIFNQYTVDSCGLLRCSKKLFSGSKFIRNAEANEFPCATLYDTSQKNK